MIISVFPDPQMIYFIKHFWKGKLHEFWGDLFQSLVPVTFKANKIFSDDDEKNETNGIHLFQKKKRHRILLFC